MLSLSLSRIHLPTSEEERQSQNNQSVYCNQQQPPSNKVTLLSHPCVVSLKYLLHQRTFTQLEAKDLTENCRPSLQTRSLNPRKQIRGRIEYAGKESETLTWAILLHPIRSNFKESI